MTRRTIVFALAAFATILPGSAAQITERTTYFSVRGSTIEELDADLQRRGPVVGTGGNRHPGATSVQFDGHVSYRPADGGCRVDDVQLSLELEITLPRWRRSADAAPQTALIWNTLADDIERHEREHAAIARHWLRRMESALRNLGTQRDCRAIEQRVNATTSYYLRGHERAQRDFDIVEGREVNFRLRRALRSNLAEESRLFRESGKPAAGR